MNARSKGRAGERQAATILGGKRAPLSGGIAGTGDVLPGDLFGGFLVEVKRRARLPHLLTSSLAQAQASIAIGDPRRPLVLYREDRGRWMAALWAEDFVSFASALAEVGQGSKIRQHLRRARAELTAAEAVL